MVLSQNIRNIAAGITISLSAITLCTYNVQAQEKTAQEQVTTLPDVKIKDLQGQLVQTGSFKNDGKPMVINFWATWCKPCILELSRIHDVYDQWREETGVKVIAISIDDARNALKVAPFINGQGWDYEVFIDENRDFARAMNVINVPFSFLVDGNGKVVWQHNAYSVGDEDRLFERIKKLVKGEQLSGDE